MDTNKNEIDELLIRILENTASNDDIRFFSKWMIDRNNKAYFKKIKEVWNYSYSISVSKEELNNGWKDYMDFMIAKSKEPSLIRRILRTSVAVAAVFTICFYSYLLLNPSEEKEEESLQFVDIPEIQSENIVLKVGNDLKLEINDKDSGLLYSKGIKIKKSDSREIVYEETHENETKNEINEIIVPAGERFSVVLSDGTKVWLNSESAIRYETHFAKDKRIVTARGNVYFEVSKDPDRPFIVLANGITTEVIGTSFEINTFNDQDNIWMTLVEGQVRVKVGDYSIIARPDQQVLFNTESKNFTLNDVDAKSLVAWKDGIFKIKNECAEQIFKRIERWYGVSIINNSERDLTELITAEFDGEELLTTIAAICANLELKFEIQENYIYLED